MFINANLRQARSNLCDKDSSPKIVQFAWPDKFSVVDVSLTFSSAYGLLASCQELWEEITLSILLHYNVSYVIKSLKGVI